MSTDLQLVCKSHDPHIWSEDVGNKLAHLPVVRGYIKRRENIVKMVSSIIENNGYFGDDFETYDRVAYYFLWSHPECELGIRDEYGREYDIEGEDEKSIPPYLSLGESSSMSVGSNGITIHFKSLTQKGREFFGISDIYESENQ